VSVIKKLKKYKDRHAESKIKDSEIDIEELVDTCFSEEFGGGEQNLNISEEVDDITSTVNIASIFPFKKRKTLNQFELMCKDRNFQFSFTFEEDFRLHELIVRRDHLDEEKQKYMMSKGPMVMSSVWGETARSIKNKGKITYSGSYANFVQECSRDLVSSTYNEVFNEFRSFDRSIAQSAVFFSFPAAACLTMATLDGTRHLGLKKQTLFMGYSGKTHSALWDQYFPHMEDLDGIGLEDFASFTSPWAQTMEDEAFFMSTCREVSQLLGADLKLHIAYLTLLVSSQPDNSPLAGNAQLRQLQTDLGLLLYRYLTTKLEKDEAAEQTQSLMEMLAKLHRCGDILMKKRITRD